MALRFRVLEGLSRCSPSLDPCWLASPTTPLLGRIFWITVLDLHVSFFWRVTDFYGAKLLFRQPSVPSNVKNLFARLTDTKEVLSFQLIDHLYF